MHDDDEQRFWNTSDTAYPPASGWIQAYENKVSALRIQSVY
jgi:hypothetical protein